MCWRDCNRSPRVDSHRFAGYRWPRFWAGVALLGLLLEAFPASAAQPAPDTLKVYWLDPIEVTATRLQPGEGQFPVSKDDHLGVFDRAGFTLINKGIPFASDLFADGYRRGDIAVVIDGERYPNSCPNRMDPPTARVNPLEVGSVDLVKTSGGLQSGIGGAISFHRVAPAEEPEVRGGLSTSLLAGHGVDGAFAVDDRRFRFAGRVVRGEGQADADGRRFTDLYGYRSEPRYQLSEFSVHGDRGEWQTGVSVSLTSDVPFPYLRMDERTNRLWSAFASYDGNKVYVNRTRHRMDNGLRSSKMAMSTDARNLIVGLTGRFYEAYYRNWDALNEMSMTTSQGTMQKRNHLIPDLDRFSGVVRHAWSPAAGLVLSGKVGIVHDRLGDGARLGFYRDLYPGAGRSATFAAYSFAAGLSRTVLEKGSAGILAEVASDAPEPETLYIALQRLPSMGQTQPWWSGNPTLAAPTRATVRGRLTAGPVSTEAFCTRAHNYVAVGSAAASGQPYMTYRNLDALMTGFQASANWRLLDARANYTWAENTTDGMPLAEIPPLTVEVGAKSPSYRGIRASLRLVHASSQSRVDQTLSEGPSPGWTRLDARISWSGGRYRAALELANLNNALYYQHLSYLRDPFSSGAKVYEPGRSARLSLSF